MSRLPTLFAIAAISTLVAGLLASRFDLRYSMSFGWRGTGYMIPNSMLCYGAALFFCLFAFVYSIWIVPWSVPAQMWHLGLSVFFIVVFSAAAAGIERSALGSQQTDLTLPLLFVFSLSPVLFLLIQGFYLLDSLRRCWPLFVRS